MDKKTVYGLVLIGTILVLFNILGRPSEEELKKIKADNEKARIEANKEAKDAENIEESAKEDKKVNQAGKEEGSSTVDASAQIVKGELIRLENAKMAIDFSTQGGKVAAVYLKEYETYNNHFDASPTFVPLALFKDGDAVNELAFPLNGKKLKTGKLGFKVKRKTDKSITLEWSPKKGQSIAYTYFLKKDAYDLDYSIRMKGFEGLVAPQNVRLDWATSYRKTERLLKSQRMVSTICYMHEKQGMDYLSESMDDEDVAEENIEWVAFKQSYFSSILRPDHAFEKKGTKFKVRNIGENSKRYHQNIKDFTASMNLNLSNTGNATVKMNWFFGPNEYNLLKTYDSHYDDILNFGWGLFRWINLYCVEPIFSLFTNAGVGMGVAILLLTIILKLILMPIQWKMYVSQAKMRILKPEIEELNKKFPNKEDAMKKQVEMMALYKESGASPLSGCVPMLIQMPILMSVFKFFPATFDLRQKAFLWAEDLSSYDSVLNLGFHIPLYGDHVSLFTLLFCLATIGSTMLNSGNMQQPTQPGMPNMKVMMYIMPIMMIFFFNDSSAGLSYYYFISTAITIISILLIKQFFVDEEKLKAKMAARKLQSATTVKKKSKFQERLEAMQKLQQEQKNARKK